MGALDYRAVAAGLRAAVQLNSMLSTPILPKQTQLRDIPLWSAAAVGSNGARPRVPHRSLRSADRTVDLYTSLAYIQT